MEETKEKYLISSALIVKVSNGYILYENRMEYENRMDQCCDIEQRRVFESKESLCEFLTHSMY